MTVTQHTCPENEIFLFSHPVCPEDIFTIFKTLELITCLSLMWQTFSCWDVFVIVVVFVFNNYT